MPVCWLSQVRERDASAVGAKAVRLARMLRAGLPVPAGFCVGGRAYREHLGEGGRLERIRQMLGPLQADEQADPSAALAAIRACIADGPLAPGLRDQVERHWRDLGAPSVAVRSSATAEDLAGESFAGQYDTYLAVRGRAGVLDRVKDCWASLWSRRAFAYRRRSGSDPLSVDMAVIVQAMVPAEAAGVMFTADPVSGRRDCAVIEASFGLGASVVSGTVAPDRIVVSKRVFRVERRQTNAKAVEVVPDACGGVREQAVEASRAGRPCLDDATAGRLALLGSDIEALFAGPQDVEWAVAAGELYVLQARPITALPPERDRSFAERLIWTNANVREVAPDVMTPMTWSLIRPLAVPMFAPLVRRAGLAVDVRELFGLIAGRVYFNANMLVAMLRKLPGRSAGDLSVLFGGGGQGGEAPTQVRLPKRDLPPVRLPWYHRLTRLPRLVGWLGSHPMRGGPGLLARFAARTAEAERQAWRLLDDDALVRHVRAAVRELGEEGLSKGTPILMAGMSYCLLLMAMCRRWLGSAADSEGAAGTGADGAAAEDPGDALANRLLTGLGGLEDAEAGVALWALAAKAQEAAGVRAAVSEEEHFAALRRRLADVPAGQAFLAAWADFMAEHGHHTRGEIELANPRWAERPDYVLALLRSYLAGVGRADPAARARRLARRRRRLRRRCLRRLGNPLKRMLFDAVLRRAQQGLRFRETSKSRAVRWLTLIRRMLGELGDRLVRRGLLGRREDVFFLELAELAAVVSGRLAAKPAVARRRAEYGANLAVEPPPVVFGRFDAARAAAPVVDDSATVLRGMGVSAGVARGPARVILHAGDAHVRPGEVLVAPFTDPGWTPYFLNAAGIVTDQGGQLSHGSIVAREYGIPCAANVGSATRIIRTGRLVEVDGDRGVVRILD